MIEESLRHLDTSVVIILAKSRADSSGKSSNHWMRLLRLVNTNYLF